MKKRTWLKRFIWTTAILFVLMNLIAAMHAYKFTHYTTHDVQKSDINDNAFWMAITGVNNPRPANHLVPEVPYETVMLEGNFPAECWLIKADSSIGTVVVCHGYGGTKSSMLDKANEFLSFHYSVLLLDFMGSGGSEGDQTTIGYLEAEQVKSCYDYLLENGEKNIVLFGTSMGSVAIMKAVADYNLDVRSVIVECPFGSLYQTVCARFSLMNLPSFPMAGLLTFWGGIENGFWAFDHEPVAYAAKIRCPVLLLYGEADPKVSRAEIDDIYSSLQGSKQLVTFPKAGHENYLTQYKTEWENSVTNFIDN